MADGEESIVIVGAGQAGARAAIAARAAGFGGRVRMFGAETHHPYERPLLSKALLKSPDTPTPFILSADDYAEQRIEVCTNCTVVAIDRAARTIALADGRVERYDRLLLATGSTVRRLSLGNFPAQHIHYLRTLDDVRAIERRIAASPDIVVVGGGFIGLEVAATLAGRGCRITLVEAADRLLPRLGCPEASAMVLRHHRASGVDVRLGTHVVDGAEGQLTLSDGAHISCAFVIGGVGVVPETALAAAAGLAVDDGILVDASGQTSDPSIFAAGDVTRHFSPLLGRHLRLESWDNANVQADAAGRSIAGQPTAAATIPWIWSDQGSLNLQMAGAPAAVGQTIVRGDASTDEGISIFQFDDERLVGGVTLNRGKEMAVIRRLLEQGWRTSTPAALQDTTTPLRSFLPARTIA